MEDKDYLELYVIIDKVSARRVTAMIPCVNRGIALNGFANFVQEEASKGMSPKMYVLRFVGKFTGDGFVKDSDKPFDVCSGDEAKERFDEWVAVALAEENA